MNKPLLIILSLLLLDICIATFTPYTNISCKIFESVYYNTLYSPYTSIYNLSYNTSNLQVEVKSPYRFQFKTVTINTFVQYSNISLNMSNVPIGEYTVGCWKSGFWIGFYYCNINDLRVYTEHAEDNDLARIANITVLSDYYIVKLNNGTQMTYDRTNITLGVYMATGLCGGNCSIGLFISILYRNESKQYKPINFSIYPNVTLVYPTTPPMVIFPPNYTYFFSMNSTTPYTGKTCNINLLFSNKLLKPKILLAPSYYNFTYSYHYDPGTMIVKSPNATAFIFKDDYFEQWYYVPPITCYNNDVIPVSAYLINEREQCYNNGVITEGDVMDWGQKIEPITILFQNNNITCAAYNTTEPYNVTCYLSDKMAVGSGWKIQLVEIRHNTSFDVCVNTTSFQTASLSCDIENNKLYALTVYARIKDKYFPIKTYNLNMGLVSSTISYKELTYVLIAIFLVAGFLLFPYSPEYVIMGGLLMFAFVMFSGMITYWNIAIQFLLILGLVLLILLYKR